MRFHVERLPNGYWRIYDRRTRLGGLFHADGRGHHGDLTRDMARGQAARLIAGARAAVAG